MQEQLLKFLSDLKAMLAGFLALLSPQQKRLLFIGLPVFGSLAYAGFMIFNRMNYGSLYSNLTSQDGAAIVKELEAEKIPYTITGGGTVIEVPRGVIYKTRLKLAGKGVPAGSGAGFEIFEKTPFGTSEFTQQVNYLRALQGELSRTINSLSAVQSSRVHLALPARSSFLGPEEKPSASVVVDLRLGYHLSPDQVQGIVNLVASSVPKLSADKVTVIDSSGRPLKEIVATADSTEAEKLNALKLKHEKEIEQRIETMLDPVLGPGKVVVRANVQINAQETQTTREEFEREKGAAAGASAANRPGENVAYEVGRTTRRIVEPRGQIQKLSVAVLVDGKYENEKYIAHTRSEIEVIKGMVKRAIGFDGERGDEIEVANVPFKIVPAAAGPRQPPELMEQIKSTVSIGAGGLFVLGTLIFLLMRRKSKPAVFPAEAADKLSGAAPAISTKPAAEPGGASQEFDLSDDLAVVKRKIAVTDDHRKAAMAQIARDYHDAQESDETGGIEALHEMDAKTLGQFLKDEHPQTAAFVLAHLDPPQAGEVLTLLPEDKQPEIALRISRLENPSPGAIDEIGKVLRNEIRRGQGKHVGGVRPVAEILNFVDKATEERVMTGLSDLEPELADGIRHWMFTFEDLGKIDDQSMQALIRDVEKDQWVMALRTASPHLKKKIFAGMSEPAGALLKEEMAAVGPVRRRDVETAQREVIDLARRLEGEGKVFLTAGKTREDVLV